MDPVLIQGFLEASVRVATPLLLAALGEMLAERGGVINLGIEGAMLAGALGAALGATSAGVWGGVAAAVIAGVLLTLVFVIVSVRFQADQIITGTAITLAAVGLTGVIYRHAYGAGGAGLTLPTFAPLAVPGLSRIPIVGPALFAQSVLVYLAWAAVPCCWWLLFKTRWGLALRAAGEDPAAAAASGVRVIGVRAAAVLAGGAMAGLAGGTLVLAQVGTFAEEMTAGRGFIAIAIVVLGRWHPVGVLGAALLFGAATALQFIFQAMGLGVPYQLFLVLPYLLALIALAGGIGRARIPAALGRPLLGEWS